MFTQGWYRPGVSTMDTDHRPRKQLSRLRVSLRASLIVVTVVCAFLGWRGYQEAKLHRLERRLGELMVDYHLVRQDVPSWRKVLLGVAVHTRVDRIRLRDAHLSGDTLEEAVDLLLPLGGAREVVFDGIQAPIPRHAYEQIARLESVERIVFDYCEPRDVQAMEPLARLPKLREIFFEISWAKMHPFPFDFYLSLPQLKVLGLPSWSDEEAEYVTRKRPDLKLEITDFPP